VFGPPAQFKSNGNVVGGYLLPEHYGAFADWLCDWIDAQTAAGVTIAGLSLQNEPDFSSPGYESALYTPEQYAAFAAVVGPLLASRTPGVSMLCPEGSTIAETVGDETIQGFMGSLIASAAWPYVGKTATHVYWGAPASISGYGRPVWQTEWSRFTDPTDLGMPDALLTAQNIHDCMAANFSAWHYWTLMYEGAANCGIYQYATRGDSPPKRFWAMGNYSRFIRPGYTRIGASGSPAGVKTTAYESPGGGRVIVVVVNTSASPVQYDVVGLSGSSAEVWTTDATRDLARQSDLALVGGAGTLSLPALSVTTLVGTSPPSILIDASPASFALSMPGATISLINALAERLKFPGPLKIWNGTALVDAPWKVFDGSTLS
jgi:glucuronoarabinoxylan endo-1,4-beta-xylanase